MGSLSNLPTLSTPTPATPTTPGQGSTNSASSTSSNGKNSQGGSSQTSTGTASGTASSFITTGTDIVTGAPQLSTSSPFHLTGVPTIAGAGIPSLVIPYTADAPFMQKSNLPEGTVFIAVGAVLATLGACVLLWRGLVAWSINHSVKKAALASLRGGAGSEKDSGTRHWRASNYHSVPTNKSGLYKDEYGSSMSLEALTSTGRPVKPHFRESVVDRSSTVPQGLFFSPTAHSNNPSNRDSAFNPGQRASAHMPAGYYASPAAQVAGGAQNATLAAGYNSVSPYARHSYAGEQITPPSSSGQQQGSTARGSANRSVSRDGTASARHSYIDPTSSRHPPQPSALYAQPSSSSLMVGANSDGNTSRAPSAYLDDLFENHGNGPRERF